MNLPAEPLFFTPIHKETIWGGDALRARFNRPLAAGKKVGESWEISGVGGALSVVSTGPLQGTPLSELLDGFPLLVKFIDARERLSVQVHPDDAQAQEHGWGRNGKTECWYVVDAEESARIIAGFRQEVTCAQVSRALEAESLDLLLDSVPVKKGDAIFIPAGTVHAIMGGLLLYEVQESSDTTLRLYDWGRAGADGKPRTLHVREALTVIDTRAHDHGPLAPVVVEEGDCSHAYHAACRYFALERYVFGREGDAILEPKRSFRVITAVEGTVRLEYAAGSADIPAGTTALLPACLRDARASGNAGAEFLLSSVPDLAEEVIAPLRRQGVPDEAIAGLGGFRERNDIVELLR